MDLACPEVPRKGIFSAVARWLRALRGTLGNGDRRQHAPSRETKRMNTWHGTIVFLMGLLMLGCRTDPRINRPGKRTPPARRTASTSCRTPSKRPRRRLMPYQQKGESPRKGESESDAEPERLSPRALTPPELPRQTRPGRTQAGQDHETLEPTKDRGASRTSDRDARARRFQARGSRNTEEHSGARRASPYPHFAMRPRPFRIPAAGRTRPAKRRRSSLARTKALAPSCPAPTPGLRIRQAAGVRSFAPRRALDRRVRCRWTAGRRWPLGGCPAAGRPGASRCRRPVPSRWSSSIRRSLARPPALHAGISPPRKRRRCTANRARPKATTSSSLGPTKPRFSTTICVCSSAIPPPTAAS